MPQARDLIEMGNPNMNMIRHAEAKCKKKSTAFSCGAPNSFGDFRLRFLQHFIAEAIGHLAVRCRFHGAGGAALGHAVQHCH